MAIVQPNLEIDPSRFASQQVSHKNLLGYNQQFLSIIKTMDRLYNILEQAQSVVNFDDSAFPMKDISMDLSSLKPAKSSVKAVAHKATTASAKKRSWKKPKDKPKRPLSAYNLFFQHQREEILASLPGDNAPINDGLTEEERRRKHRKTHGKIGFADLARIIADKWKSIEEDDKAEFVARANVEKQRYLLQLEAWKRANGIEDSISSKKLSATKSKAVPLVKTFVKEEPKPDSLMSMLQSSSQPTQMNKQMPNPLLRQRNSNSSIHEFLMAQCRENLMRQTAMQSVMQSSMPIPMPCMSQINNMTMLSPTPINLMSSPTDICNGIPDETFSKETFFDDFSGESDSSYDVFSDSEVEEEKSLEDDLHSFLHDFDSDILLTSAQLPP